MVLLLAAAAPARAAQGGVEQYYGRTITSVRFEVDGRVEPSADLERLVDVRAGALLTREDVRASMDHLFQLGRYDDITPVAAESGAGVAVVFRLVPRYPITRVEIEPGDTGVPPNLLRDELRQRFTGVATGIRLPVVEEAARRFLNDAGYPDADVTARTVPEPAAGRSTLLVGVRAGRLATIRQSRIEGASPLEPDAILARTDARPGRPFRRRDIETRLTEIEDDLRARGYYDAQAALVWTPAPDGAVDVVLDVDAGPRVDVRLESRTPLPRGLDDLIPVKRQRSIDLDLLEDSKTAIEQALRREGYAAASVAFSRQPSADGAVLDVVFTVDRGPRYYVDRIELPASMSLAPATVRALVGIEPGDVLNQAAFEAGLAKVIDEYRRLGYYRVKAEPERQTVEGRRTTEAAWVVLVPNITEGPRGTVTAIAFAFDGPHEVPERDVRAAMRSRAGAPFVEQDVALDHRDIQSLYRERGYLGAIVALEPTISEDGTSVALAFEINEGPQVVVGRVTVIGNTRVSEQQILEVAALTTGAPLGASTLTEAQRRLNAMGVFRHVSITTESRLTGESEANILISVTEAPTVTLGFGGGLEGGTRLRTVAPDTFEDHLELSPRGFFQIGRRNIGGRNRSVNFFSRVSLKPRSAPGDPERDGRGFGFAEYRVTLTYREQRLLRTETDLLVGLLAEQVVRTTYSYQRRGVNAEFLRRASRRTNVSGRYALEFTRLFDERINVEDQPIIDRLFPQVRLSTISTGISWDGRDNPIVSTTGAFLSADMEVAARALASEVGYVKGFFQGSTFRRTGSSSRTVVALRGQLGLARGFPRTITSVDEAGVPTTTVEVQNLPVSQRFFAGGGTSVRGFQVDRLGVFDPGCAACSVIDRTTGLSVGGTGLIVLNAEIRHVLTKLRNRNLAVVTFLDGGNVFAKAADVDLAKIRGAAGFGVRYDSPLGPVRLDFGFKLRRQVIDDRRESGWEYHLSIGEAF